MNKILLFLFFFTCFQCNKIFSQPAYLLADSCTSYKSYFPDIFKEDIEEFYKDSKKFINFTTMQSKVIKNVLSFEREQVIVINGLTEILSIKYEENSLILYTLCYENSLNELSLKIKMYKTNEAINFNPSNIYLCTITEPTVFHIFYSYE